VDRNDRYVPGEIYISVNGVYVADDTWFVLKDSPVAIELQHRYEEVRNTYTAHVVGGNFPENIPPEPLVEDEKKISRFYALLNEYQEQNKKCAQQTYRKKSEIHAWQAALAFYQLKCCYQQLNEREKTTVIAGMAKQKKLPSGMKIDSGPELIGIGDVSLLQGTDRDNFEFFLKHSYAETDYMSAWGIAEGDQMEEISKKYTKSLKEKNIYRECE
jgi:2-succinyl-5-enolpyruvyl-6-hydroxy-3-cyclohexene-1-carboxylate synthase